MSINKVNTNVHQFCTFWISDRMYGINILEVKEIIPDLHFTPIPHAPSEIKGYVNIRGEIFLILGLSKLLGFEEKEIDEASKLLIFKNSVVESFGVLVDRLGDIIEVSDDLIEVHRQIETGSDMDSVPSIQDIISGTCKLKDRLVVILTAGRLLEAVNKRIIIEIEKGE